MKDSNLSITQAINEAIKNEAFPGAGLCVIKKGQILLNKVYGYSEKIPLHKKMTQKTVFDIASLTKPIATGILFMLAYQEGKIDLDDSFFPSPLMGEGVGAGENWKLITLRHLLNHTAGLPDYREYYKIPGVNKKIIIQKILSEKLLSKPGEKVLYSDLGYILLGVILERIYDAPLDELFQEKIVRPFKLQSTFFHPLNPQPSAPPLVRGVRGDLEFAATEFCQFRKRMIIGEVMDENCFVMGGVAGHAGLFSTCEDVAKWLMELRKAKDGKSHLILKETFEEFCSVGAGSPRPEEGARTAPLQHRPDRFFALGFETPSHPSSSGKYFSPNSLGHLGYTGTSFWWDVEKDWMVIFLTNRVHPTRENKKIQEFRPKLHDLVVKEILKKPVPSNDGMTHKKNETQIRCGFPDDF